MGVDTGKVVEAEPVEEALPQQTAPPVRRAPLVQRDQLSEIEARIAAARDRLRAERVRAPTPVLSEGDVSDGSPRPLDRQEMFGREYDRVQSLFPPAPPPTRTPLPSSKLDGQAQRKRREEEEARKQDLYRYRPYQSSPPH